MWIHRFSITEFTFLSAIIVWRQKSWLGCVDDVSPGLFYPTRVPSDSAAYSDLKYGMLGHIEGAPATKMLIIIINNTVGCQLDKQMKCTFLG